MDAGGAEEHPYFAHEDIKHGHGGDFLVQQYLQNINKQEENNNDTTAEPIPDVVANESAATEEGPYFAHEDIKQ